MKNLQIIFVSILLGECVAKAKIVNIFIDALIHMNVKVLMEQEIYLVEIDMINTELIWEELVVFLKKLEL